jgi:hypothetical protein
MFKNNLKKEMTLFIHDFLLEKYQIKYFFKGIVDLIIYFQETFKNKYILI